MLTAHNCKKKQQFPYSINELLLFDFDLPHKNYSRACTIICFVSGRMTVLKYDRFRSEYATTCPHNDF